MGVISCFCGVPFSYTKITNIFTALGSKGVFFQLNFAKQQIKKIIGYNHHLMLKEYKSNDHQVYEDELQDLRKFIKNIINN